MLPSVLLAALGLSSLGSCKPARHAAQPETPGFLKASVRRVETSSSRRSLAQMRYSHQQPPQPHLRRQFPTNNSTVPRTNLTNILDGYEYMIDIAIGTPPQNVSVIFDTGSDQTWINPLCDSMAHEAICVASGVYNISTSSTGRNLSTTFAVTYGSGSVDGWYVKDTVAIAGVTAENVQFGVATYSYAMDAGIVGLGYDSVLMDELKGQGKIDNKDFSVALGPNGSPGGEIVLSGVDTRKYSGSLQAIPMLDIASFMAPILHYDVNLTYVGVTPKGSCRSQPATEKNFVTVAIVDTGSTINHIPWSVANRTASLIPGARYDPYTQLWKVSCHYADSADTVDFGFGDVVVNIPMREFIWRNVPMGGQCYLGMVGDAELIGFSVLGDTFLRGLTALYQPEKKLLHLAQYADCGSDIQSTNGNITELTGKCDRPSWDTCTSRPTPVPLANPTTWSWDPIWASTESTFLPTASASSDVLSTVDSLPTSSLVIDPSPPLITPSSSPSTVCYDVIMGSYRPCELEWQSTSNLVGDPTSFLTTKFVDATTTDSWEPTVTDSWGSTLTDTSPFPCYQSQTSICVFAMTSGAAETTAYVTEQCITYLTCADSDVASSGWGLTSATGALSTDGVLPIPTSAGFTTDWTLPGTTTLCSVSYVYVTVTSTVYGTADTTSLWSTL